MFAAVCLLFSLSYFVDGHATDNLVPFIDKCEWSDEACLVKSSQKAIPYFAKGLPELGVPPMDPLKMEKATLVEGGIKVLFTDMDVVGASKCNILKVVRDIKENKLKIVATCPIVVSGEYDASGELLFTPIEGKDAFRVDCQLIHIEVDVDLTTVDGPDSVKYWKVGKAAYSYEAKERCTFDFKNLFNGDKTKAEPILAIFNESWKDLIHTVAKPIVDQFISEIVNIFKDFFSKVPAEQLEKL